MRYVTAQGPVVAVNLDANSSGQTDVVLTSSASQVKSFRLGAIINASSSTPLSGVFGWQFAVTYNSSAFVPQGDPSPSSSYPDGAESTVLLGSQNSPGAVNWAGLVATQKAFAGSNVEEQLGPDGRTNSRLVVYLTLLAPNQAVTISAKTILANINFEIRDRPNTPQSFNITDVMFVDSSASVIPRVVPGHSASETVANDPPRARFVVTSASTSGPYAFTFNATDSSDRDGLIPNPGGYFWDFGDGTQDLANTGPVVTHDYGTGGAFIASLRVQDNLGSTGSARDSGGEVLGNFQPSHAGRAAGSRPDLAPTVILSLAAYSLSIAGQPVDFSSSKSYDPDGVILFRTWDYGDGTRISVTGVTNDASSHIYSTPGNYNVTLTVIDDGNVSASASITISVGFPFTFSPLEPTTGQIISFAAVTQFENGFSWDFGDDSTDTGSLVYHAYDDPGNYTVTLTSNVDGFITKAAQILQVLSPDRSLPHLDWSRLIPCCDDSSSSISAGPAGVYVADGVEVRGYNFSGGLDWIRVLGSPDNMSALGVAASSNAVFVVGWMNSNGIHGFATKIDLHGNLIWTRTVSAIGYSEASAVSADSDSVYVVGSTRADYAFLTKLDNNGSQVWTRKILNTGCDSHTSAPFCYTFQGATSVSLGPKAVYVVGYNYCYYGYGNCPVNFYLIATSFDGKELWTQNVTTAHGPKDLKVAAGVEGIYVAGPVDNYLRKYNFQGKEVLMQPLQHTPSDITIGQRGAYVVGWWCGPGTDCDSSLHNFVTYLNSAGREVWTLQFLSAGFDPANGVSSSPDGIFVVGRFFVSKVSPPDRTHVSHN